MRDKPGSGVRAASFYDEPADTGKELRPGIETYRIRTLGNRQKGWYQV